MITDNKLKFEDVCEFDNINKLTGETKKKMLKASARLQGKLNNALDTIYNNNLCKVSRYLQSEGFTDTEAIAVIYAIDGHRDPVGNEIERAVDLIYGSAPGEPVKSSDWPVFETPLDEVKANIKQRNIEPLSEAEIISKLGDTPEIGGVEEFIAEFFKGVNQPIYIGNRYHGIIEHPSTWLNVPEIIEDARYDQVLANPMKRKLTAEERVETVTDKNGKVKLKYASGGRGLEFASDKLNVITFEADKIPLELQLGVIRYIARHLPLVALLFSAGKSYHATFSTKGVDDIHALRLMLVDLGGDGAVMSPAQLTRLGAANRSDNGQGLQRVLWMNGDARHESVDQEKLADLLPDAPQTDTIRLDNTYYMRGTYFVMEATGDRFIPLNGEAMTRQLRQLGYSKREFGGMMSAVDSFKAHIESHNTVDAAGALAGRSIGCRPIGGSSLKYLVTRKNTRAVAKAGNWDNIKNLLTNQYGEDQLKYLYSWLHRARQQLNDETYNAGHSLVISGGVGGGKSLGTNLIFIPLMGAVADAERAMCKDNQFNNDLIGAEVLLIDDVKLSRKMEDRKRFGTKIKGLTASSGNVSCHPKGVDAFTLNPLWRLIIAINDTEDDLGSMPPLGEGEEDTIGDKIIMLKCFKHPLPFVGDRDQFAKIAAMISAELPAFAAFIDGYTIPKDIQTGDSRFGFDEFHHPDLLAVLNQNSNERTLLSVTTSVLFNDEYRMDVLTCTTTGRKYWEGSAKDWSDALLNSKDIPHRVKSTIEGELAFGDSAIKAGKKMKMMAEISDGRIVKGRSNKGVKWLIWDAVDNEIDEPENPF
jgi:hypothetical protein